MAHDTSDDTEIDLRNEPITMQRLHMILSLISRGGRVVIVNGYPDSADAIIHRMELAYIAAHEARVRSERERGGGAPE